LIDKENSNQTDLCFECFGSWCPGNTFPGCALPFCWNTADHPL